MVIKCALVCGKVNAVSKLHGDIIRNRLFGEFVKLHPDKFIPITNGVTVRRWILLSNPKLAQLFTKNLGSQEWLSDMSILRKLETKWSEESFIKEWDAVKLENKHRLAKLIQRKTGVLVDPCSIFDVMIKRLHEYKRQLMNVLYIVERYRKLKGLTLQEKNTFPARTFIIAGKAAPGYRVAKLIIKFINQVASVVNNDKETSQFIKVVFLPNYNVTAAEIIIPAADFSQHISCAGTEASGTSNMKFVMNGSVIIGTPDGANIEISEQIGRENLITFGLNSKEVDEISDLSHQKPEFHDSLKGVMDYILEGTFGPVEQYHEVFESVKESNDKYMVGKDFQAYSVAMSKVDAN